MKNLRQFGVFWYHFIIGDDWRIALGVTLGLGFIFFITHGAHRQPWWLLPIVVITALWLSLWSATRRQ